MERNTRDRVYSSHSVCNSNQTTNEANVKRFIEYLNSIRQEQRIYEQFLESVVSNERVREGCGSRH